jgi:hypothetical protein
VSLWELRAAVAGFNRANGGGGGGGGEASGPRRPTAADHYDRVKRMG